MPLRGNVRSPKLREGADNNVWCLHYSNGFHLGWRGELVLRTTHEAQGLKNTFLTRRSFCTILAERRSSWLCVLPKNEPNLKLQACECHFFLRPKTLQNESLLTVELSTLFSYGKSTVIARKKPKLGGFSSGGT